MVVGRYRFVETMGEGGESNPCYKPLYDETIDAPLRHKVAIDGKVIEKKGIHSHTVDEHLTIGPARNFLGQTKMSGATDDNDDETTEKSNPNTLSDLFKPPE